MIWREALSRLAVVLAGLLLIFWRDALDMVRIWWGVSTYAHCLFIPPIIGWLIWQRREEVAVLQPSIFKPGLLVVGLAGLGWMLGEAAGVALFRHAGLILALQGAVLTLLGLQVTRGLLFPLFYLIFLIPFGDEFVPPLQTITAKMSLVFLDWANIPAHIEGVFIQTPSGLFEVAEACSGVKFLVAMVAYGALVANICFKSWPRRIAFMVACVIIPILANGVRAYGIMHISDASNASFAESVDHVIWGWMFFAFVMAITMVLGWRFFDRGIDDLWLGDWVGKPAATAAISPSWLLAIVTLFIASVPVGWQTAVARIGREPVRSAITLPEVPGWTRLPVVQSFPWQPHFKGADHRLLGAYRDGQGRTVELGVAFFGWQEEGKEIVGFGQGAIGIETQWSWANDTAPPPGGKAERIFAPKVEREVVTFYVTRGITTGSASRVKMETLKTHLFGGDQAAVAILVTGENGRNQPARPAIDAFVTAMGPPEKLAAGFAVQARKR